MEYQVRTEKEGMNDVLDSNLHWKDYIGPGTTWLAKWKSLPAQIMYRSIFILTHLEALKR
jgi:hypothetical protein